MLALAHDIRLMRNDRGFFCLPEIQLGMPFTAGMAGLVQARLSSAVAHSAMTTGQRYGGAAADEADIVNTALPAEELYDAALSQAEALAPTAGPNLAAIRTRMYKEVIARLQQSSNHPHEKKETS